MNANQNLIDYQNELLQKNLDSISFLNLQIASVRDAISTANSNIDSFNAQINDFTAQISELSGGNELINETIVILLSQVQAINKQ